MAVRIERNDPAGLGPLWRRPDQRRRGGIGQIGAMAGRPGAGSDSPPAGDRAGAAVRADRVAVARVGPARLGKPAMAEMPVLTALQPDPRKFRDPFVPAAGERRAQVALRALDTLWFNTGTLCNLTCHHCYIESSPKNDRLVYLTAEEVAAYLDEIQRLHLRTGLIGLTGGEPVINS